MHIYYNKKTNEVLYISEFDKRTVLHEMHKNDNDFSSVELLWYDGYNEFNINN